MQRTHPFIGLASYGRFDSRTDSREGTTRLKFAYSEYGFFREFACPFATFLRISGLFSVLVVSGYRPSSNSADFISRPALERDGTVRLEICVPGMGFSRISPSVCYLTEDFRVVFGLCCFWLSPFEFHRGFYFETDSLEREGTIQLRISAQGMGFSRVRCFCLSSLRGLSDYPSCAKNGEMRLSGRVLSFLRITRRNRTEVIAGVRGPMTF